MNLDQLISICKKFSALGWSIQEQLESVAAGSDEIDNQNANAMRHAASFLANVARAAGEGSVLADEANDLRDDILAVIPGA